MESPPLAQPAIYPAKCTLHSDTHVSDLMQPQNARSPGDVLLAIPSYEINQKLSQKQIAEGIYLLVKKSSVTDYLFDNYLVSFREWVISVQQQVRHPWRISRVICRVSYGYNNVSI